jgi:hypothetical protein
MNLGNASRDFGNSDRAVWLFEESLSISREIGYTEVCAHTLACLSKALLERDLDRAERLLDESLMLSEKIESTESMALCHCCKGHLARARGRHSEASNFYRESYRRFHILNSRIFMTECLEGLANVASDQKEHQKAALLFGTAAKIREALGTPLPPADRPSYEHHREATCAALGQVTFNVAWAEGQALSLDEVLASVG